MTALLFIASVVLLYISPLAAQSEKSQTEPYGFHDIQLGMSIAEFKAKHRAPKVEKYTSPSASPLPGEATCAGGMKKQQRNDPQPKNRNAATLPWGPTPRARMHCLVFWPASLNMR